MGLIQDLMQIIEELVNYQSRHISKGHPAELVSTTSVVITSFTFFLAIISHIVTDVSLLPNKKPYTRHVSQFPIKVF